MKARKIWIAEHPTDKSVREVEFSKPIVDGVYLYTSHFGDDGEFCQYIEYVCIPVETE